MSTGLDSELAANVKTAKTKRMYFAFVAKGSNDGALVLSKTKVSPVMISVAKKKAGAGPVSQGACFGEDGKIVFEMAKEPPATMDAALKHVIQRDAGITQACVCRRGTNSDLGDGEPQKTPVPTTTQSPKQQTAPQKTPTPSDSTSLYSKYSSLENELSPQLTKALKEKQGDTEKMKTVFKFARDNAGKKQYDKAIQGLNALRGLIETGYSTVPSTGSGYDPLAPEIENKEGESEEQESGKPKMPYDMVGDLPTGKEGYTVGFVPGETSDEDDYDKVDDGSEVEEGSEVEDGSEEEEFAEAQVGKEEQQRREVEDLRRSSATAQKKLKPQLLESEWGKNLDLRSYKTGRVLGKGAFGATELLQPTKEGQPPLVIKIPLEESGTGDLQKEVDFYKKVGEHPNFVKCLGITEVDGQRGLVLEAVKGKDMGKSMNLLKEQYASGKLSHAQYWGAVQHTMRQTLEAIAHLEEVGVVHNDIRMDNIMCDEETGQMKVLDFGISVKAGESNPMAPIGYGTVSPDTYGGKPPPRDEHGKPIASPLTSKHDVFSVGAATFQAGEGQQFDYHSDKGTGSWQDLFKFAAPDEEGNTKQAIRPGDKDNPAFKMKSKEVGNEMKSEGLRKKIAEESGEEVEEPDTFDEKTPQKVAGRSGANTAYTEFVNKLMNPDPSQRMSVAEALEHPFLSDSLMSEEEAREVFKSVLAPPKKPEKTGGGSGGGSEGESEEHEEETTEQAEAREKYTDKGYSAKKDGDEEEESSETSSGGTPELRKDNPEGYSGANKGYESL
jgi:serine/threonine protein kinase